MDNNKSNSTGYPQESLLVGWKEIAGYLRMHPISIFRKRPDLIKAGVVFYRLQGKPKTKRACAFPSMIQRYCAMKAMNGEMI